METQIEVTKRDIAILAVIVLLAIVVRGVFAVFTTDDAYITLRYAQNLQRGKGFVYNLGEHVYGTTTPLFTFILAGFSDVSEDALLAGKILNLLCDAAIAVILFGLAGRVSNQRWVGHFAALLYALNPVPIKWSASGMETGLYTFLICLSFWQYERQRFRAAYGFAALAIVTRIDGALAFGMLFLVDALRRRRGFLADAVVGVAPFLLWVAFAVYYFGSPIPHSAWAKKVTYGGNPALGVLAEIVKRLLFRHGLFSAMAAIPALFGMFLGVLRRGSGLPIVAWWFTYWAFFVLTGSRLHGWYFAPPVWVYALSTAVGVGMIANMVGLQVSNIRLRRCSLRATVVAVGVAVIAVSVMLLRGRYTEEQAATGALEAHVTRPIGLWLHEHAAPTDTVCLESIGAVGYYSGLYVLDEVGLVSPAVMPLNRQIRGGPNFGAIVRSFRPTYYVWWESWEQDWWRARPEQLAWLDSAYTKVTVFSGPGTFAWAVWRRK